MNNYLQQKQHGNFAEKYVKDIFSRAGFCIQPPKLKCDFCLILGNSREFLCEVKFDRLEFQTGNVVIEYYNPKLGKPSGLGSTQSDLWFIVLQNPLTVWMEKTNKLKEFVQKNKPFREVVGGDNNSAMFLYSRAVLFEHLFARIDYLSPEELRREFTRCHG